MHKTLSNLKTQLETVITQLQSTIPSDQPFSIAQGNWSFPGLTRIELVQEAQDLVTLIDVKQTYDLGNHEAALEEYLPRLQFLQQHTLPNIWANANQGVSAYLMTLTGLRRRLNEALDGDMADSVKKAKTLTTQLRAMETRLATLEPRTASLGDMVVRIEQASEAADNLPADLDDLREARLKIASLTEEAVKDQTRLLDMRTHAEQIDADLKQKAKDAQEVLERTERAYSGATSLALASAFSSRCEKLERSVLYWIAGLILSLVVGGVVGSMKLQKLVEILGNPDVPTSLVMTNILMGLLAVGAPVWFAWLSTKQIGHRFRLAEDYAFKASISQAYDGFRREAVRVDKTLEQKLLSSALARFDEQPLRLVETATHGSPFHEFASSPAMGKLAGAIPNAVDAATDAAKTVAGRLSPRMKAPAQE